MKTSKNSSKSNRAAADYFELSVCKYTCETYGVDFKYTKDMENVDRKTRAQPSGEQKIQNQSKNLSRLKSKLKKIKNLIKLQNYG